MIVSAALFLAFSAAAPAAPLAELTQQNCSAQTFDKVHGYRGSRAIISDDGSKAVVECGDGSVRLWKSGETKFEHMDAMPLFRAAQAVGIVPADTLCPWSYIIRDTMKTEADCDILDHDAAKNTYVLQTPLSSQSFVVQGKKIVRESAIFERFGALIPTKVGKLAIVNVQSRPELLQLLTTGTGDIKFLAILPSSNLIFEDSEGSAGAVKYSVAYKYVIVPFGGAFRVANKMTYVRAFTESGIEKWKIERKLPERTENRIVGEYVKLTFFASGRYALMAKTNEKSSSEIINLKNGATVANVDGWPLAASRDSSIALVREPSGTLSLIDLGPLTENRR